MQLLRVNFAAVCLPGSDRRHGKRPTGQVHVSLSDLVLAGPGGTVCQLADADESDCLTV